MVFRVHVNKCKSWVVTAPNFGTGKPATGAGCCTADGWLVAFGGTEERERRTVCGVAERGTAAGYRADGGQRRDGVGGWVRAHGGDYADAQSKGFGLTLLHTETSGAIAGALDALLRRYDRLSRAVGTVDTTEYGQSPASPRTYYRHHLAAHSAAVVFADVVTIHDDVQHLGSQLTRA